MIVLERKGMDTSSQYSPTYYYLVPDTVPLQLLARANASRHYFGEPASSRACALVAATRSEKTWRSAPPSKRLITLNLNSPLVLFGSTLRLTEQHEWLVPSSTGASRRPGARSWTRRTSVIETPSLTASITSSAQRRRSPGQPR